MLLMHVSFAQKNDSNQVGFSTLQSKGKMPKVLLTSSSEKYKEQAEREISKKEKVRIKNTKHEFYLNSTFQIDALIKRGNVTFGDEMTEYLNKIKNTILEENELDSEKERIQVFTVKSPSINAFATDQGILFFTTGLMARLENEAQVAFILCHEITHYLEKHNVNSYIMKKTSRLLRTSELVESLSKFSKENEFSADKKGFELFKNLDYPKEASINALNILGKSHVSNYSEKFDLSIWEDDEFQFPTTVYRDSVVKITPRLEEKDSISSHPSIKKRTEELQSLIKHSDSQNNSLSKQQTKQFSKIKEIAIFETLNQNVLESNYQRALYDAYNLKKKHPKNPFIDHVLAYSIYGIGKLKTNHSEYAEKDEEIKTEGPQRKISYLAHDLTAVQLCAIALKANLDMSEKYPKKKHFKLIAENLAKELVRRNSSILADFKMGSKQDSTFHFNALHVYQKDNVLSDIFDKATKSVSYEEKNPIEKKKKKRKFSTYELIDKRIKPIDNIIIYDPKAIRIRKYKTVDLLKTDKLQGKFNEIIKNMATQTGMKYKIYSSHGLGSDATQTLNDMAALNQHLEEILEYRKIEKIPFTKIDSKLKARLGTGKILFMSMEEKSIFINKSNYFKLFAIYTIPDVVSKMIFPQRIVTYENLLIDIDEQKLLYYEESKMMGRNNLGQIQSKYYNLFYKLQQL